MILWWNSYRQLCIFIRIYFLTEFGLIEEIYSESDKFDQFNIYETITYNSERIKRKSKLTKQKDIWRWELITGEQL